jgi:glycosyltransferase involved in cell wall biosynthesis
MTENLVSVIMPVYNAGADLHPAVESVLRQTYPDLELLIVDDGSTDGCLRALENFRDPRIRLFHRPHAGRAAALNFALRQMAGAFYAIQDADDLCDPRKIERQVDWMVRHPRVAAVFTGYDLILDGNHLAPRCRFKGEEECRAEIEALRMPSHDPTVMFRVALTRSFTFDESLPVGAGLDHILRIGEQHSMLVIGECLYSYRIRLNSNSRRDTRKRAETIRMIKERARKRRGVPVGDDILARDRRQAGNPREGQEHGLVTDFMESILDQKANGKALAAFATAWACLRLHPLVPRYYKPLAYWLAPLSLIRFYRLLRHAAKRSQARATGPVS